MNAKSLSIIVAVAGVVTALIAFVQLMQQSTQFAVLQYASTAQVQAQSTENSALEHQLSVQREMATVLSGGVAPGPTATALAQRVGELQSTQAALATIQYEAGLALTPQFAATTLPSAVCTASGRIPPLPQAPPAGCVLLVEWWVRPYPTPCGLLITRDSPS